MHISYKDKARTMFEGAMEIVLSDIEKAIDELEVLEKQVDVIENESLREELSESIGRVCMTLNRILS